MELAGKEIALAVFILLPVLMLGITFPIALRFMEGRKFMKRHIEKLRQTPLVTFASVGLTIVFVISSVPKLISLNSVVGSFEAWGYPAWFMYVVGILEFVAGVALLSTRAAPLAATALAGITMGAVVTHLSQGAFGLATIPALLFVALSYIGVIRALQKRDMFKDMWLPA